MREFDPMYESLFSVALESVGAPAYLVDGQGGVVHANAVGAAILERAPSATKAAVGRIIECALRGLNVPLVSATQVDGHWLVVDRTDKASHMDARVLAWCIDLQLTPRQRQVARLLAGGATNSTIATTLDCSERTVEVHVSSILLRAAVSNRAELVAQLLAY